MLDGVSIIIPVVARTDEDLAKLQEAYADAISNTGVENSEFIYIASPDQPAFKSQLAALGERADTRVLELARDFGESVAISIGAEEAQYDWVLTLPSYNTIQLDQLSRLFEKAGGCDAVMVKRGDRKDSSLRQLPSRVLNSIVNRFSDAPFADASCGVRLFRKNILDEINLYGDFHRFFSLLAYEQGFRIELVELTQLKQDVTPFSSGTTYLRHLLDVLTILFLTRFNKRPLRFFGSIGSYSLAIGGLGMAFIAFQRLFLEMSAADRPLLILFVLFFALGVQLIAIGLVGESLIFTHAKEIKEYKIRKVHSKSA